MAKVNKKPKTVPAKSFRSSPKTQNSTSARSAIEKENHYTINSKSKSVVSGNQRISQKPTRVEEHLLKEPAAGDNIGVNLRAKGTVKTEKHHIATDKSKKFDFKNHPAFKETGINVSKDIDNLVDLANHRGRHTNKYHQEVQDRLDAVYNRYGATDKLEGGVRAELRKMKQELLDGNLDPYGK